MILTSHIIVGGLAAGQTKNYLLAALIGLATHYILDMIPHWEYPTGEFDRILETHELDADRLSFWSDLVKVGLDALFGFTFLIIINHYLSNSLKTGYSLTNSSYFLASNWPNIVIGGFFGMLPDILQFFYWIKPSEFLKIPYRFPYWIHTKVKPRFIVGVATQILTIAITVLIVYYELISKLSFLAGFFKF